MLSNASRYLTYLAAALYAVLGVWLVLQPAQIAPVFAWTVSPFVTMTIGGWCLGNAMNAFITARRWSWALVSGSLVYFWSFGLLELAHVVVGDRPGPRLITRCHVKEHELSRDVAILKILLASSLGALDEQVEPAESLVQKLRPYPRGDELREVVCVAGSHLCLRHLLAEHLVADRVQQQARGDVPVGGVLLDQGARR